MPKAREILDPNHTLPVVDLDVYSSENYGKDDFLREKRHIRDHEGKVIGRCELISREDRMFFRYINVDERIRGKGLGYGLSAYLVAIELATERNLTFETDDVTQTEGVKKIWEHLAQVGLAEVVEPFEFYGKVKDIDTYKGKYRVSPGGF